MDGIWAALKGAKRIEWILAAAAAAALILIVLNQSTANDSGSAGTALETRMEAILSSVRGAGRVRVMVSEEETVAQTFSETGKVRARGVVIVAEGADDIRVSLELSGAAQALLDVKPEHIQVLKMEEERG